MGEWFLTVLNGPGFLSNHLEYMKYLWELSRSCTIQFRRRWYIHIDSSLEERAKTKLVVGIQDLEAQVENFFCLIETNILFGWMDIDVCLWMISVQSSIISDFSFTFLMAQAHWQIEITLRYIYTMIIEWWYLQTIKIKNKFRHNT